MASRTTMARYMGHEGSGGGGLRGGADDSRPGLISMIAGTDKVTGGPTVDQQGNVIPAPYTGSKGFGGGWSQREAARRNEYLTPLMLQQLQGKQTKELSAQEANQEAVKAELANRLQKGIMKFASENAVAGQNGITAEQLPKLIPYLLDAAISKTSNIANAEKTKPVQDSYATGIIGQQQAQDAINRRNLQLGTGMGGVATMPGAPGQPNSTVYGGTREQTTTQYIDHLTGMAKPITREQDTPGRASIPIPSGMMPQGQGDQQPLAVPTPQTGNLQSGMQPQMSPLMNYINGQQGISTGMVNPNSLYGPGPSPAGNVGQSPARSPSGNNIDQGAAMQQLLQAIQLNSMGGFGQ